MQLTKILLLILLFSNNSYAINWELSVVYPDNEKKLFILEQSGEVSTQLKTWDCSYIKYTDKFKKEDMEKVRLSCGTHLMQFVNTVTACAKSKNIFNDVSCLDITDPNGKRNHHICVSCKE